MREPIAYFITFRTYGTKLQASDKKTVGKRRNAYNEAYISPSSNLKNYSEKIIKQDIITLNERDRYIVMNSIIKTCSYNKWRLYALHIRTNHAHLLIKNHAKPAKIMTALKAYASRELNQIKRQKYWARHGSTRYVWSTDRLYPAMYYIIEQQGTKMACHYETWYDREKCNGII